VFIIIVNLVLSIIALFITLLLYNYLYNNNYIYIAYLLLASLFILSLALNPRIKAPFTRSSINHFPSKVYFNPAYIGLLYREYF